MIDDTDPKTLPLWVVFGYEDNGRVPAFTDRNDAHAFQESFPAKMALRMTVVGPYPSPLEKRDDGKIVPLDRWESGFRAIVKALKGNTKDFEIDDIVKMVESLNHVQTQNLGHCIVRECGREATWAGPQGLNLCPVHIDRLKGWPE